MAKQDKRQMILDAAYTTACDIGFDKLRRDLVAQRASASSGSINYHFPSFDELRDAVVEVAIKQENLTIIGHALAANNKIALRAPRELRVTALVSLA